MSRPRPRLVAAILAACAVLPAAAEARTPAVHAHRGGSFVDGKATFAENTLPAFRAAARAGFVLELDARVISNAVVVFHDDTLDRTTACSGKIAALTLTQLRECPADIVGSPGSSLGGRPKAGGPPPPLLAAVLAMARQRGATVNLEIKDFDLEATRAQQVLDVVAASGMPAKRLIIQSFFPQNLEAARERLPAVPRSMLALSSFGEGAIDAAVERGAVWVSPQWPITRSYVLKAKARGLKVVPFTLNRASQVRTAKRIGVDAVISDDPVMARRVLR